MTCDWIAQGWAHIHPTQDVEAAEKRIALNLTTHAQEARKFGSDAERAQEENARYRARQQALEAHHGLESTDDTESNRDPDI